MYLFVSNIVENQKCLQIWEEEIFHTKKIWSNNVEPGLYLRKEMHNSYCCVIPKIRFYKSFHYVLTRQTNHRCISPTKLLAEIISFLKISRLKATFTLFSIFQKICKTVKAQSRISDGLRVCAQSESFRAYNLHAESV